MALDLPGLKGCSPARPKSIGDKSAKFHAKNSHGEALLSESGAIPSQREAIIRIGRLLGDSKMPMPAAIGHRIVHGGPKLRQHCLIDDSVLAQLESHPRARYGRKRPASPARSCEMRAEAVCSSARNSICLSAVRLNASTSYVRLSRGTWWHRDTVVPCITG